MDELFSCRNCIHNSGQSINIGRDAGFCLKHSSVLFYPDKTTCKYLHRKDLPRFVVEEGVREHAGEFAVFSGIVELTTHKPVARIQYSERFVWERHKYDPLIHGLAQYRKTSPSWVFIQAMSGGVDGRRGLAHAGLIRRYMDHCGTWKSSYRLVLALVQELPVEPCFGEADLNIGEHGDAGQVGQEALWDVVFARIGGIQEYGFHAGIEGLMWATDELDGGLSTLDWPMLKSELMVKSKEWTNTIIAHAVEEGVFFGMPVEDDTTGEESQES
jgi:hypothetical protein